VKNILQTIQNISIDIQSKVFQQYNSKNNDQVLEICDKIILDHCGKNNQIKSVVSSYTKEFVDINEDGSYILAYNPIDNLDLLSLAFSVGSIFTVYKNTISNNNIAYCAYAAYGPTFQFVSAVPNQDVSFLSFKDGQFKSNVAIKLNDKGKINSTAGCRALFLDSHKEQMKSFFDEGYRLRYSGSLALDTHQILFKKGGLYSSPVTKKDPNGTHSLVFELYTIATILELCGGYAIDGKNRILDIQASNLSTKSPVYFGSKNEIDKIKEFNAQ
jgi:fructose-1,6-bisphosphatase I